MLCLFYYILGDDELKHEVIQLSQSVMTCLCELLANTHSQEKAEVVVVNSSHLIHLIV